MSEQGFIPKHGGYQNLASYKNAVIVYDLTVKFCEKYIRSFKLKDQMEGAARSGKQNIVEGCMVSGTSKESEIKLIGVARASQEELLEDFKDFLRQKDLNLYGKEHPESIKLRKLEQAFLKEGGLRERMYDARRKLRRY